jgi:hypothetical protein
MRCAQVTRKLRLVDMLAEHLFTNFVDFKSGNPTFQNVHPVEKPSSLYF